ncbi:HNH/endonuclease VII fold toxin-2 domain-containing protein [Massilia sp. W12]|uniref:HNH/endonuclease VII fold toxin-2 domain-containing protein n=1 Tax=Massilia sp. W12 TaxID=3126507 RepID=UPI0030D25395
MASGPNTPVNYYMDTAEAKKECAKDQKQVEQKCKADEKNKHRGKGRPKSRTTLKAGEKDAAWVLDHCGPLLVQPGDNFQEWLDDFKDISSVMSKLAQDLGDKVITKIEKEILEYGAKALGKMALRRGLTGWIPVVGWIMTAVDVAVTAVDVATRVDELKSTVTELKSTVSNLKEQAANITQTFQKYENQLKNYSKLSKADKAKVAREVMVDVQAAYAAANPCLRARKCTLVPYNKGAADKWMGKGCCPGQTGHHLLPDAMFRDPVGSKAAKEAWDKDPKNKNDKGKIKDMPRSKLPKLKCWDGYSEGASPTICAEGANQYAGSHGVLHEVTSAELKQAGFASKNEMPYTSARDLILGRISKLYGCDKKCLQAQLDAYYCGKAASKGPGCPDCKHASVVPHDGKGKKDIEEDVSFED